MGTDLLYGGANMNSTHSYDFIDYDELLESINGDLEDKTLTEDSVIYLVRQKNAVKVGNKDFFPVMDYFYDDPELNDSLTRMKVVEAKKLIFDKIEKTENEAWKETLQILVGDLQAYTKNRSKRNDNDCFLLFIKDTDMPIMLFFEEEEPSEKITSLKVSEVLAEIDESIGKK